MQENRIGSLEFLSYRSFEAYRNVTNVVTTRLGGSSTGAYESLNLAFHVGDDSAAVLENRAILARAMGFELETLTVPEQVHKTKITVVKNAHRGKGALSDDGRIGKADAMVTNMPEIPIMVLVADCVAVSFFDTKRNVIGLAHAGWKGTLGRIAVLTLKKMESTFGCEPADVIVGLSPSIGRGHYEVGSEVLDAFVEGFGRKEAQEFIQEDMDGTCYLDLWAANEWQLKNCDLPEENITVAEMCTSCHPARFFSHRHESGNTGRFAGLMMLHGETSRQY